MRRPNARGQAMVEFLGAAPLLALLFVSFAFVLGLGWIQLEISSMTQEYGVCLLEQRRPFWCRMRFEATLAKLPGGFRLRSTAMRDHEIETRLHHHLPLIGADWSFREPLPKL